MRGLGRFVAGAALALAVAGMASADQIIQTSTFSGTTSTEATYSQTASGTGASSYADTSTGTAFDFFQSAVGYAAGDVLQSVTLSTTIDEQLTSLTFRNNGTSTQSFSYFLENYVGITGNQASIGDCGGCANAPTADVSALKSGIPTVFTPNILFSLGDGASSEQTIAASEVFTYTPGSAPVSNCAGSSDPGCATTNLNPALIGQFSADNGNPYTGGNSDLNPFVFTNTINASGNYNASGQFQLGYLTNTSYVGQGGGITATPVLVTNGSFTLTYNFLTANELNGTNQLSGTPEPATMVLFGSALLAIGILRKRARRR
jgi:hypothetical protein